MRVLKHTPGPWFSYPKSLQVADKRFWFAEDGSRHGETPNMVIDCMTEADCHLIAAAPDLLEALQAVLAILPVCPQNTGIAGIEARYNCAVVGARAAIAKATGESND